MKNRITLITVLFLCSTGAYSQTRDAVLNKMASPQGVTMVFKSDTNYFDSLHQRAVGIATFSASQSSVYYFVFPYTSSDSLTFWHGMIDFHMNADCVFRKNPDWNKNFESFTKNGYYFLLQMCPCVTVEYPDCAVLAERLNAWIKEKHQK